MALAIDVMRLGLQRDLRKIRQDFRQATPRSISTLLARLIACGKDVSQGPFASAPDFLVRILDTADPGHRHLVYGVSATLETLVSVLHADTDPHGATHLDDTEALELATVLAIRLAALPGSLVMRSAAQEPRTPSTAVGCERETSTPSRPETMSTPTASTSTPVTPSHEEHYVGKIRYGSRGSGVGPQKSSSRTANWPHPAECCTTAL